MFFLLISLRSFLSGHQTRTPHVLLFRGGATLNIANCSRIWPDLLLTPELIFPTQPFTAIPKTEKETYYRHTYVEYIRGEGCLSVFFVLFFSFFLSCTADRLVDLVRYEIEDHTVSERGVLRSRIKAADPEVFRSTHGYFRKNTMLLIIAY